MMVSTHINHLLRCGAITCLVVLTVSGCQQSAETDTSTSSSEVAPESDATSATSPETAAPQEAPSESVAEAPADNTLEAQPEPPIAAATPEQSCSTAAFVADTDPAGLNIRGGPGSEFGVQDTLPTNEGVEVSIVGATNGWFLINEAYSASGQLLSQPGWVYAPLLGVTTTSLNITDPNAPTTLYAAPDGSASVKAEIPIQSEVTLLSCSGNWLEVQADGTTGWLAVGEQCSNPNTTCP